MSATDPRAVYRAEVARRKAIGRPTPPADTSHRYLIAPPGTRQVDPEKRARKLKAERDRYHGLPKHEPPRIPPGRDRTCGNCGRGETGGMVRGRCKGCDRHYRVHGVERSVTPRYGAGKL